MKSEVDAYLAKGKIYTDLLLEQWGIWNQENIGPKPSGGSIFGKADHGETCIFSNNLMEQVGNVVHKTGPRYKRILKKHFKDRVHFEPHEIEPATRAFDLEWNSL